MKTFIMIVVVIIMLIMVVPNEWFGKNAQASAVQTSGVVIDAMKKEKKVIEAIIVNSDVLYVTVSDDGTNRNGFAEYLCGIAKEHYANLSAVKVMKVGSTKDKNRDNAYGVLLGQSDCK